MTGVLALAVAVLLLGYLGANRVARSEQSASSRALPPVVGTNLVMAPAAQIDSRPTLLAIGDSYVGGTGDPSVATYPERVVETMGWSLRVDAVGGSGYLSRTLPTGRVAPSLADRLAFDKANFDPDFIIIDAGRNDLLSPVDELVPAIEGYLRDVRSAWPRAKIVVIKPQYASTDVPESYPEVASAIDRTAAQIDAAAIDPIGDRWWDVPDLDSLLLEDNVHLNGAGSDYYAQRVVDALRAFGINPVQA
ncbi:SGNH/GDSL hydrolase family protein [Mycolicibacterium rufum]|uniref:SGNH/GDSL hydrolase family protein n=1 Tax=Mycolicibacterium rufum TaxID=318424 RepID=A0A9X2YHU1_9MYCO|nr:SGNH/GDSL hydrolase family protein [Mycolicibacterium rufum]MCV7073453.1 SGNH/GDSL hydrolase family protein [Mycolicibacterium rufum]ULP38235.1 SGNH/GDSL hydrolase family protein [Mycolicibacterium rufum]